MADNYLAKSGLEIEACLSVDGALALERYDALHAALLNRVGEEAAALFAEPLVNRGNDTAAGSITWYTERAGNGVPLTVLDEAQQQQVSARLARSLMSLEPLVEDPELGPLVASALYISDPGDVWVVDGKPVVINWGMVPGGNAADRATRAAQYARGLGRFLPMDPPPPLTFDEQQSRAGLRAAAAATAVGAGTLAATGAASAATMADQPTLDPATPHPAPPADPPTEPPVETPRASRGVPLLAWVPLLVLLLIAGGVLAWLLVPGNRLFPPAARDVARENAEAVAMAEGLNRDLEAQIAVLERAVDGAQCTAQGVLLLPDGRTVDGLLPPDPDTPATQDEAALGVPTPVLTPAPDRTLVTPADPAPEEQGDTATLLDVMERRTALVVALGTEGMGTGSGFFVGPDLLVTNHHVIAGAKPDGILVTSQSLGQAHPATVLKSQGPFQDTGGDFALLRVQGVDQPSYEIHRPTSSLKLQAVVAAGYPGDVIQSDTEFQALLQGQGQAAPDLTVTRGTVNSEQDYRGLARVVVHSAGISQGNSGGPLVDTCGRVVGVNTFANRGELRSWNFALDTEGLLQFLQDTPAASAVTSAPCNPRVERVQATPVPEAAAPDTAPPLAVLPRLSE